MEHFKDVVKVDKKRFQRSILGLLLKEGNALTTFVVCNNITTLLEYSLETAKVLEDIHKRHFDVYYQLNPDFHSLDRTQDFSLLNLPQKHYEEKFKNYCNYFDTQRITSVLKIDKLLVNCSKNNELTIYHEYPTDINMILIIQNCNFWDLNSQLAFAKFSEHHSNILFICQIRSDFDYAINHFDKSAINRSSFVILEEEV